MQQVISQRVPPATRTKARWQPYYSIPVSSLHSNSPLQSPQTNTMKSSVSLPPFPAQPTSSDISQPLSTPSIQTPKEPIQRDSSKHKFATSLIDQAVHLLSETWCPENIPLVFQGLPKASPPFTPNSNSLPRQPTLLSSAILPPSSSTHLTSISAQENPSASEGDPTHLLPIKTFVHEVLKRSRTSGSILQAALCYLQAIRSKVPGLLHDENMGIRAHYCPDSTILPATPEELERDAELSLLEDSAYIPPILDDSTKTICITNYSPEDSHSILDDESISSITVEPSTASSSTPPLPSPLLCPRRTFLAALILASKFFQDKCYSNRAWAKVSGLPAREIGRCERALGQALEWRLWVGKNPVAAPASTPTAASPRTVVRSQSEGSVAFSLPSNQPFFCVDNPARKTTLQDNLIQDRGKTAPTLRSGLRRCSTVPTEILTAQLSGSCDSTVATAGGDINNQDGGVGTYSDDRKQRHAKISMQSSCTEKSTPIYASSPDIPSLTYSPSSTECSSQSGDQTIQMSIFEDTSFPAIAGGDCLSIDFNLDKACLNTVGIVGSEVGCGMQYMWCKDSHYMAVEATGVY